MTFISSPPPRAEHRARSTGSCASEGRGGRKCPKEQPKVPDSSPGSLANVASWARGLGRGLPQGPCYRHPDHPAELWTRAEAGHTQRWARKRPNPAVANACSSRAADSLGVALASPTVRPSTRRDTQACGRIHSPAPTWKPGWHLQGNRDPYKRSHTRSPSRCSSNKINPSSFLLICGKIHL